MIRKPSKKQILINTFGGKCQICGYDKCPSALVFHHRDPKQKKFNISRFKKKSVENYEFLRELEKCVLLCANCHAEYHSGHHKDIIDKIPEISLVEYVL